MRYQFITGKAEGSDLILYARDENGRKTKFRVLGFEPYFYVEAIEKDKTRGSKIKRIENNGYLSIDKRLLTKIVVYSPEEVPKIRSLFSKTYEADIKYVRRFLIDTGIRSGFEINENESIIHYKEIRPVDFSLPPITSFIDIEVYSKSRFPNPDKAEEKVICVTFTHQGIYHTLLLDDKTAVERRDDWVIYRITEEKAIFSLLSKFFEKKSPDVLAGWNIDFDIEYLKRRSEKLGLNLKLDGICVFDLLRGYSTLYRRGGNRLKEVAYREGFTKELEEEVNYGFLWENNREELLQRNLNHVKWIKMLDEKYKLVDFYWSLKNYAGLESIEKALYAGVLVDTLLLRKYKGKYVLPSKSERNEEEKLTGALILKPKAGLYENVAVFDVSRYYPNLLANLGLSPEGEGLVPQLCRELLAEREKYDKELKALQPGTEEYERIKAKRDTVKYLSEAIIGYFGSRDSRLFNPRIFNTVTGLARDGLRFMLEKLESLGYEPIYADTDGIMVKVDPEKAEELLNRLNEELAFWCDLKKLEGGLRLKEDRYYKRILFTGVKKRYAGWVIREGGKPADYIHIVGFEAIRRDASLLTQRIQREIFDIILRRGGEGLVEYLREVVERFRRGEFSLEEIAIRKTLHKPLEEYGKGGSGIPDYVRGCIYANRYLGLNIIEGDLIKMIYVKNVKGYPKTDVVSFLDERTLPEIEIDYEKMIDRSIRLKVEDVLKILGLEWSLVYSPAPLRQRSLSEVFA